MKTTSKTIDSAGHVADDSQEHDPHSHGHHDVRNHDDHNHGTGTAEYVRLGCVENGPAAALLVGYVPHQFLITAADIGAAQSQNWCGMRPPTASPARTVLPTAHFERNAITIICETVH